MDIGFTACDANEKVEVSVAQALSECFFFKYERIGKLDVHWQKI